MLARPTAQPRPAARATPPSATRRSSRPQEGQRVVDIGQGVADLDGQAAGIRLTVSPGKSATVAGL